MNRLHRLTHVIFDKLALPATTRTPGPERSGNRLRPRTPASRGRSRSRRRRGKIGSVQEDVMRLQIQSHRLGSHLGFHRLDDAELVRESSWKMCSIPSRVDAKIKPVPGS